MTPKTAVVLIDAFDFRYDAKTVTAWTSGHLDTEHRAFLSSLPVVSIAEPFTLVHGSLRHPIAECRLDRNSAVGALNQNGNRLLPGRPLARTFCLLLGPGESIEP